MGGRGIGGEEEGLCEANPEQNTQFTPQSKLAQ